MRDNAGNLLAIIEPDSRGYIHSFYPIQDGQGSIVALTNGTGTINDTWTYDPYGQILTHTGTDYNPWQYTASYTDTTTGLIHDGTRYYDPTNGRFTQQDPAGQGNNIYIYVGDNPTNNTDPNGLDFLNLGISFNLGPFHASVGVDIGSNGIDPYVSAGAGASAGASDLPISPVESLNSGDAQQEGSSGVTGCVTGACTDTSGNSSIDFTGATGLSADDTYTF